MDIKLRRFLHLATGLAVLAASAGARAAEPTALVEDVVSGSPKVVAMQFLVPDEKIDLGNGGEVVLSYLGSCVRETVTGGTITIGERQSTIAGGVVVREKVNCDTDQLVLTSNQANESGVVTFRAAVGGDPVVTVYGTRPVFVFEDVPAEIVLERRDLRTENVTLQPDDKVFDLATTKAALFPGGVYKARAGDKSVTIRVDSAARASHVPVISRLVRF